ncbi:hypothetical protein APHAL10511_008673 [Amanita phalloides]|nr:hypothetical protein APHAL10511_008673 [Amanita phalloides]
MADYIPPQFETHNETPTRVNDVWTYVDRYDDVPNSHGAKSGLTYFAMGQQYNGASPPVSVSTFAPPRDTIQESSTVAEISHLNRFYVGEGTRITSSSPITAITYPASHAVRSYPISSRNINHAQFGVREETSCHATEDITTYIDPAGRVWSLSGAQDASCQLSVSGWASTTLDSTID